MAFKILWEFDAFLAAVLLYFFLSGLARGSVSSFNLGLWLGLLSAAVAVLVGSAALRSAGHAKVATVLLLVPAVTGVLYGLFMLMLVVLKPKWN